MKRIKRQPADDPKQELLFDADRYCVACKRRLTGEKSCQRRYGPTCWRKKAAREASQA